jgi:hypothetical protein
VAWVKLDDAMGEHRKVKRALRKNRSAVALHFLGILHCSRYLTDGFVEDEYVEEILPSRERKAALDVLIEQGLWVQARGGYTIHDYLEHNPTREKVLANRATEAARKARGRNTQTNPCPPGQPPDKNRSPAGIQPESGGPVPSRPVPVPPLPPASGGTDLPPTRPSKARKTDLDAFDQAMTAWGTQHFPNAAAGAVSAAIDWLRTRSGTPVTAEALTNFATHNEVWADQLGLTTKGAAA